jgi:hypothetical protein
MKYKVEITDVPAQHIAVSRFTINREEIGAGGMASRIGPAFGAVMQYVSSHGLAVTGPPITRYEMHNGTLDVSAGFPVADMGAGAEHETATAGPEADDVTVATFLRRMSRRRCTSAGTTPSPTPTTRSTTRWTRRDRSWTSR